MEIAITRTTMSNVDGMAGIVVNARARVLLRTIVVAMIARTRARNFDFRSLGAEIHLYPYPKRLPALRTSSWNGS